jgi:UDP-N-acetylglucosamine transferase subunit ALG13
VIFVSVGTNETRFDRMVEAVSALRAGEQLFVQYGSSSITSGPGVWRDFLSFDEMEQAMRAADVVVCHAGAGSILLARRCGHRPIVMARLGDLGEAVDDHQLPLARRLHEAGLVVLVEDETLLTQAVAQAEDSSAEAGVPGMPGASALAGELRQRLVSVRAAPA